MKKSCLLLSTALLLSLALTACSASSGGTTAPSADNSLLGGFQADAVTGTESAPQTAPSAAPTTVPNPDPGGGATGPDVYDTANVKRILRATVSLQTTGFDAATAALEKLVAKQGGYFESAEIQQGSYYDAQSARYGSYVIRVPQENYDAFLTAASGVGHVVNINKSSQDVGQVYFDTEARLKTLRTQQDRLLALLEKADTMENIISLESALADVEYQIEQYATDLRRYDSLIGYSTVNLTLDEVLEITEQPKETVSLGGRIVNAFQGGMDSFGRSMGNLAVWLAYNFVGTIIFLAAVAIGTVAVIRGRRKKCPPHAPTPVPVPPEEEKK